MLEFISAGGLGEAALAPAAAPGAPSLLEQGRAMRDALLADLLAIDGLSVACAVDPVAPLRPQHAGHAALRVLRIPPDESVVAFLARTSTDFDAVIVVAPESDGLLCDCARAVGPSRWIGARLDALQITSSKAATRAALASAGIAVPPTPNESQRAKCGAWVVKPDDGAGAEDTRRFADFSEAQAWFHAVSADGRRFTLEAWVEGTAMSLSVLAHADEVELLAINRQRIDVDDAGVVIYRGVETGVIAPHSATGRSLAALAAEVQRAIPGLAGFYGIDIVVSGNGTAHVIEVNPRLTCAYVELSARLGRNLAEAVLRSAC